MPLYSLTLPLLFFVGFAAILVLPGLKNGDLALLTLVRQTFPAWFLGVVGGAGALTAMVPAAILILSAATLFAKNFFRPMFRPAMSDDEVAKLAKVMVVVITGGGPVFRHLQLDHAGRPAAAGLRRDRAVFSRRSLWSLLETGNHGGGVRRDGGGSGHGDGPGIQQARSVFRHECRFRRAVRERCDRGGKLSTPAQPNGFDQPGSRAAASAAAIAS